MFENYFNRFGYCDQQIKAPPDRYVELIVVIPTYNENDLNPLLHSLSENSFNGFSVEIIFVINASANDPQEILARNNQCIDQISKWQGEHQSQLTYHIIDQQQLPPKHAGVGLARKIGMDEAIRRFDYLNNNKGIIVCLDADCTVASNYLLTIYRHFKSHPNTPGCSIHFEHRFDQEAKELESGIVMYELFLRYYKLGLGYARLPYAFHTIGSSMACSADAYVKQGGMNKRKAGEDFYFLQKIIALGNFTEIWDTSVYPSNRTSDRVPFGTGAALTKWMNEEKSLELVYSPKVFEELRMLTEHIPEFWQITNLADVFSGLNGAMLKFLVENDGEKEIQQLKDNCSTYASFEKRFFNWFNGFLALKFVHFATDNFYEKQPIKESVLQLMSLLDDPVSGSILLEEALIRLRDLEKQLSAIP